MYIRPCLYGFSLVIETLPRYFFVCANLFLNNKPNAQMKLDHRFPFEDVLAQNILKAMFWITLQLA